MGIVILQALFFFLPSYVANAVPVIMAKFGWWEMLNRPIDNGKKLWENPLFGSTKTWRGIIAGVFFGSLIGLIQSFFWMYFSSSHFLYLLPYPFSTGVLLGALLGLGEGLGDLLKSFIKRRLNVKSSASFFPFDQLSFLGALFLASFIITPSFNHLVVIIIASLLIPVLANRIAYMLGWKKVPW